jgi:amidase
VPARLSDGTDMSSRQVIGRMSATTSLMGKNCGRRQLCLNDLTDKMLPLKQEQLDVMFASGVNTIVNGLWGWDNLPPTVSGAARRVV